MKALIARVKAWIPQPLKEGVIAARRVPRLVTARARVLPDYVVFGAMRCGTSSLYLSLTDHPQVLPAFRKQVRFFDRHFHRGLDWYRAYFPLRATARRVAAGAGRAVTGEASPEYIFHPLAPARIAATLPDVRLVALLRDPVERAWSHYRHEVRIGRERLSFAEALDAEPARLDGEMERMTRPGYRGRAWQDFAYVAQGMYAEHLERWFEHFPREQIMIVRAEDMFERPEQTLAAIADFIGVDPWRPRYTATNAGPRGSLDRATRERLTTVFAPHNRRLGELLGRDMRWT